MNAKEELLKIIKEYRNSIKCADLLYKDLEFILKINHTKLDLNKFLSLLDFEYDNTQICQQLFGTVWLKKYDFWLERKSAPSTEWWTCKCIPSPPLKCIKSIKKTR